MMRRYPAYRNSGVEWLGEVPEDWGVVPARRLFRQVRDAARPEDEQLSATQKHGVLPQRLFMAQEDQKVVLALAGLENFKHVEEGDFVISLRSFQGGIEYSAYLGCVSPAYTVLRGTKRTWDTYFKYLLKCDPFINILQSVTSGIRDGRNVSYDQFGMVDLPFPPLPEQTAIAAFLDRETAKIDALVDEQRRLIALLREKRQAVISHAVTKGLNPAVSMKPSGVDWLGDVPEGWTVAAIKRYCAKITDGAHISPDTEGGVFPFVSTKDVSEQGIDLENCLLTSETSFRCMQSTGCQPYPGDILFSKDGTIGRTAIVNSEIEFVVASSLIIIRPRPEEVTSDFLNYLCQSKMVASQVSSFVKGAGLPRLSITNLLKIVGSFPPLMQQQQIVDFLDGEVTKLDALAHEAEAAIALLQERRAALISAAVTGKIDVRDLAPAQTEAA